jgi:putative lipase involved disintegration of autophagic bodies
MKIKEGDITITHHSTASVIQIIVSESEAEHKNEKQELWIDYYQWEQLKKAIAQTENK